MKHIKLAFYVLTAVLAAAFYIAAVYSISALTSHAYAYFGEAWTQPIAGSGVTIGLAYYLTVIFVIYKSWRKPYEFSFELFELIGKWGEKPITSSDLAARY